MNDTSTFLALRNFGGVPEITPNAYELKQAALLTSKAIEKIESEQDQSLAVTAMRELKILRVGIEATRKSVKAPVLDLGKQIDGIASDFIDEVIKEELRLQGHINHFQQKLLAAQRAEEERIRREQKQAIELEEQARKKKEESVKTNNETLKAEAKKLEEAAIDAQMGVEFSPTALIIKPRGLVVKNRLNFQVLDAIVFCQAYPQFFSWNAESETLKLKRREILEELNREDGKGIFHVTQFPEELPDQKGGRIAKPPGIRIFEETKSHVR